MSRVGVRNCKRASFGCQLRRHVYPPIDVVVNHAVVVVPENVQGQLCALDYAALQLQARSWLEVFLRRARYFSLGFCKTTPAHFS